jgi:hypothetical protein
VNVLAAARRLDTGLGRRGHARHVLVDARTPLNFAMVAPVVSAMAADARIRFVFTASEDPGSVQRIYREAPPDTTFIGPARAALRRWDAYLTSDFMWARLARVAVRIQMFHGVAGKYGFDAPTESLRAWDRLFFVNERRFRNILAAGAIDADSTAPRLIGMPKVDCLVDGSLQRDAVLEAFGLDPSLPTVLYAPTWSPSSSLNLIGEPLIRRLVELPINVLVKLHDRSLDPRPQYSGGANCLDRIRPLLKTSSARLVTSGNIAPCLAAADILISDHSSAAFEFLLLDRPVVRIEIPALLQQANVHPDYIALMAECSTTARTVADTLTAVERELAEPSRLSASRRRVAKDLFFRPGSAKVRCALALYDAVELAPPESLLEPAGEQVPCALSA